MIPAESKSYPVLGAADEAGVPYGEAWAYLDAHQRGDGAACGAVFTRVAERFGTQAAMDLGRLIIIAVGDGRIYSAGGCGA